MADDQNQQGQQSNAARIQAMLDELARVREAAKNIPAEPRVPGALQGNTTPPPNLPTRQPIKTGQGVLTPKIAQDNQKQVTPTPDRQQAPLQQNIPQQPKKPEVRQPVAPIRPEPPTPAPKPAPPAPRQTSPQIPPKPPTPPTRPLPPPPKPPEKPSVSPSTTVELRTMQSDIRQIETGKAPEGIRSNLSPTPPPIPSPTPKEPQQRVAVPAETGGKKRGKILLFAVLGLIGVVLLVIVLSALFGGSGSEQPSPTPSPTASLTPAPSVVPLSDYFGSSQLATSVSGARTFFLTATPEREQAISIAVNQSDGRPASTYDVLNAFFASVPQEIQTILVGDSSAESALLAYGQTELFDPSGQLQQDAYSVRPILILEISNVTAIRQQMQSWENTGLAETAMGPFSVDTSKAIVSGFMEGTHQGVPVRYWNFPSADESLDWSVVLASNGKNYLVISGSRQSIFFAIDKLLQ